MSLSDEIKKLEQKQNEIEGRIKEYNELLEQLEGHEHGKRILNIETSKKNAEEELSEAHDELYALKEELRAINSMDGVKQHKEEIRRAVTNAIGMDFSRAVRNAEHLNLLLRGAKHDVESHDILSKMLSKYPSLKMAFYNRIAKENEIGDDIHKRLEKAYRRVELLEKRRNEIHRVYENNINNIDPGIREKYTNLLKKREELKNKFVENLKTCGEIVKGIYEIKYGDPKKLAPHIRKLSDIVKSTRHNYRKVVGEKPPEVRVSIARKI